MVRTHPGSGMPGVLCSAKVLDTLIPEVEGWPMSVDALSNTAEHAQATLSYHGKSFRLHNGFWMSKPHVMRRLYQFCHY